MVRELISRHIWSSLRTADVFPVVASLPTTGNTSAVRRLHLVPSEYSSTVVLITFRSLIYQMKILRLPRGRIFGSVLTANSLSRAQRGFLVVCPSMKQNTVSKLYAAKKRSLAVYMKEIIIKKILLEWLGDREIQ